MNARTKVEEPRTLREIAVEALRDAHDIAAAAGIILAAASRAQRDELMRLGAEQCARDAGATIRRASLRVHDGPRPGYDPASGPTGPASDRFRNLYTTGGAYAWPIGGKPLGDCTAPELRAEIERRRASSATDARIASALEKIMRRMAKSHAATVREAISEADAASLLRMPS